MTTEWLALAAIALVVGIFIGAVGVGGVLLIPLLAWLGQLSIHQAAATALFSFFFTGIAASWAFQRRGSIDWRLARPVLAGAVVSSYFGAVARTLLDGGALTRVVALVIVFAGAYILLHSRHGRLHPRDGRSNRQQALLLVVGAIAGFGSGLSGAGGPLFSVPLMLALGFAPLAAIGAGQVLQIVAAIFGTLGSDAAIDLPLAAWIALFQLVGVGLGARAAHAVSTDLLRRAAAFLCLALGVALLLR